jgi:hypothetical protein
MKTIRIHIKILLIIPCLLISSILVSLGPSFKVLADTTYAQKTYTLSFPESQQQSQSQTITLSRLRSISNVTTNTGNVSYSINGGNVTVNVSGGNPSRTYTPAKSVSQTLSSTSNSFPGSVSYNDGTYSGSLGENGGSYISAQTLIGQPGGTFWWYESDYGYNALTAASPPTAHDYIGGVFGPNPSDWPSEYSVIQYYWTDAITWWNSISQYVRPCYIQYNHYQATYSQNYSGTAYAATQYFFSYNVTIIYTTQAPSVTLTESGWSSNGVTVTSAISDSAGISTQKWALGNQTTSYFNSGGTAFTGSTFTVSANGVYSVYVLDQDGNAATQTVTVDHNDTSPPSGSCSLSTSSWTNGAVTIAITASDGQSGIKQITRPDGSVINGSTATYTATANGKYNFVLTDNVGNSLTYPVTINNIDTIPPIGNATVSSSAYTSHSVTISIVASDGQSGVASIKKPDNSTVEASTASYVTATDGTFNFVITDAAGNSAVIPVTVSNITQSISVTHPVSGAFSINPNTTPVFMAPNIGITNNSLIPINVSVESMAEVPGGTISLNDVPPDRYPDWTQLTAGQTQSDIALAVNVTEKATGGNTWSEIDVPDPLYIANMAGKMKIGVLNAGGSGNLSLSAKCGIAWTKQCTELRNLVLVYDCA